MKIINKKELLEIKKQILLLLQIINENKKHFLPQASVNKEIIAKMNTDLNFDNSESMANIEKLLKVKDFLESVIYTVDGGKGSGFFGHKSRKGKRGGSAKANTLTEPLTHQQVAEILKDPELVKQFGSYSSVFKKLSLNNNDVVARLNRVISGGQGIFKSQEDRDKADELYEKLKKEAINNSEILNTREYKDLERALKQDDYLVELFEIAQERFGKESNEPVKEGKKEEKTEPQLKEETEPNNLDYNNPIKSTNINFNRPIKELIKSKIGNSLKLIFGNDNFEPYLINEIGDIDIDINQIIENAYSLTKIKSFGDYLTSIYESGKKEAFLNNPTAGTLQNAISAAILAEAPGLFQLLFQKDDNPFNYIDEGEYWFEELKKANDSDIKEGIKMAISSLINGEGITDSQLSDASINNIKQAICSEILNGYGSQRRKELAEGFYVTSSARGKPVREKTRAAGLAVLLNSDTDDFQVDASVYDSVKKFDISNKELVEGILDRISKFNHQNTLGKLAMGAITKRDKFINNPSKANLKDALIEAICNKNAYFLYGLTHSQPPFDNSKWNEHFLTTPNKEKKIKEGLESAIERLLTGDRIDFKELRNNKDKIDKKDIKECVAWQMLNTFSGFLRDELTKGVQIISKDKSNLKVDFYNDKNTQQLNNLIDSLSSSFNQKFISWNSYSQQKLVDSSLKELKNQGNDLIKQFNNFVNKEYPAAPGSVNAAADKRKVIFDEYIKELTGKDKILINKVFDSNKLIDYLTQDGDVKGIFNKIYDLVKNKDYESYSQYAILHLPVAIDYLKDKNSLITKYNMLTEGNDYAQLGKLNADTIKPFVDTTAKNIISNDFSDNLNNIYNAFGYIKPIGKTIGKMKELVNQYKTDGIDNLIGTIVTLSESRLWDEGQIQKAIDIGSNKYDILSDFEGAVIDEFIPNEGLDSEYELLDAMRYMAIAKAAYNFNQTKDSNSRTKLYEKLGLPYSKSENKKINNQNSYNVNIEVYADPIKSNRINNSYAEIKDKPNIKSNIVNSIDINKDDYISEGKRSYKNYSKIAATKTDTEENLKRLTTIIPELIGTDWYYHTTNTAGKSKCKSEIQRQFGNNSNTQAISKENDWGGNYAKHLQEFAEGKRKTAPINKQTIKGDLATALKAFFVNMTNGGNNYTPAFQENSIGIGNLVRIVAGNAPKYDKDVWRFEDGLQNYRDYNNLKVGDRITMNGQHFSCNDKFAHTSALEAFGEKDPREFVIKGGVPFFNLEPYTINKGWDEFEGLVAGFIKIDSIDSYKKKIYGKNKKITRYTCSYDWEGLADFLRLNAKQYAYRQGLYKE